ncbi:MAG: zinc-binding dehydrogenase [Planctomycetota bacterium]
MATRMKAAWVERHGELDAVSVAQRPVPTPPPGHVLVSLRASGMNHLDLWVRRGVPGHSFPLPLVLGSDGAGVVVERGLGVDQVELGTEVIISPGTSCGVCAACLSGRDPLCRHYRILGEARDGTCAEFLAVPVANVLPKPKSTTFEEAGSFVLSSLTAWTMLVDRAQIRAGETVLVLAGGSGVGVMAIQIAKLHGCTVIATAGSDQKCARLRSLGADEVIHHGRESVPDRVKSMTARRGADVVLEHVGKTTWVDSVASTAWGGRIVTCGATTGADVAIDLRTVFFKQLSILGSTMGSKGTVARLVDLLGSGRLRSIVSDVLPLARIQDAHRLLEDRSVFGKIVIVPGS